MVYNDFGGSQYASSLSSRRRPGRRAERGCSSQYLMHVDHHALGVAGDGGDEEVLHQPGVLRSSRLEFRRGAAIDEFRVDRLVALEPLQQLRRPEADALVLDIDDCAIVGLKRIFRLQLDQLIGPDDLEVRTERADLAVDLPTHLTADDRHDAAHAMSDIAGTDDRIDVRGDGEDVSGFKYRIHRHQPPNRTRNFSTRHPEVRAERASKDTRPRCCSRAVALRSRRWRDGTSG